MWFDLVWGWKSIVFIEFLEFRCFRVFSLRCWKFFVKVGNVSKLWVIGILILNYYEVEDVEEGEEEVVKLYI